MRTRLLATVGVLALAGAVTVGIVAGYVLISVVVAALAAVALLAGAVLRGRRRLVPHGPDGDGPAPPGGAGVREPRRPLPRTPAGAAAMEIDDEDGRAVASL